MDFHSLPRRDLQALCKKNKIPANLTNVAMADALQSLKSIEWDEVIRQKLMPQPETVEQQHGSPLPRSRRVTARSTDTSDFSMEEIPDKEETKEAFIEANQTPSTVVRRSQRIQSAMSTRTRARTTATSNGTATRTSTATTGTVTRTSATPAGTRTRKGKKEEAPAEAVEVMAAATPAPQRGRKKAMETPAKVVPTPATYHGQKKAMETPTQVGVAISSARPTRQSTRRLTESTKDSRVTRTMANMTSLDVNDDNEAQAVAEKVEEKEQQTAVDLEEEGLNSKISEKEISIDKSEDAVEEKSNSNVSFMVDSEIPTEKVEESVERLNSKDKDIVSAEHPVEEFYVVESDTNVAPISDEVQVDPVIEASEINQATQADSPIMGLVSEVGPENDSDTLSHITIDAQVAPSDLCFSSPVRAPGDTGLEKMLDSVVRRFAKASIKDSAKKTESCCVVHKEEAVKIVSDEPGLVQNENEVKGKVDLNSMSLRKLKALYKDHLIEVNSKKVADEGKRLPLGKLDENLLV